MNKQKQIENIITDDEFALQMQEIENKNGNDYEVLHIEMDELMCKVLESHGYIKGVEIFRFAPKWYA